LVAFLLESFQALGTEQQRRCRVDQRFIVCRDILAHYGFGQRASVMVMVEWQRGTEKKDDGVSARELGKFGGFSGVMMGS
jgi:hypothetical protein